MNRTTAIALLLIGIFLFLGSCAPIGYVFYHEAVIDPSEKVSLSGSSDEISFQGSSGSLVRFKIEADVTTASVQEDPDSFDDNYLARFKFPISYTISDASGNRLITEDITLAWKDGGNISKSNENITSTGGMLTASTSLDKFTVPADGIINIAIEISPDTTYKAVYTSLQLQLHEGMIDNTWYVVSGVLMGLIGFILAMVGFIFAVTNSAQVSIQQQIPGQEISVDGNSRDKEIYQQAMLVAADNDLDEKGVSELIAEAETRIDERHGSFQVSASIRQKIVASEIMLLKLERVGAMSQDEFRWLGRLT